MAPQRGGQQPEGLRARQRHPDRAPRLVVRQRLHLAHRGLGNLAHHRGAQLHESGAHRACAGGQRRVAVGARRWVYACGSSSNSAQRAARTPHPAPRQRRRRRRAPAGSATTSGWPPSPAADRSGTMGNCTRLGMPKSCWMRAPLPLPKGWCRLPSASKYDMFSTTATHGTWVGGWAGGWGGGWVGGGWAGGRVGGRRVRGVGLEARGHRRPAQLRVCAGSRSSWGRRCCRAPRHHCCRSGGEQHRE